MVLYLRRAVSRHETLYCPACHPWPLMPPLPLHHLLHIYAVSMSASPPLPLRRDHTRGASFLGGGTGLHSTAIWSNRTERERERERAGDSTEQMISGHETAYSVRWARTALRCTASAYGVEDERVQGIVTLDIGLWPARRGKLTTETITDIWQLYRFILIQKILVFYNIWKSWDLEEAAPPSPAEGIGVQRWGLRE